MRSTGLFAAAVSFGLLIFSGAKSEGGSEAPGVEAANVRTFAARGVIRELQPQERIVVIKHEAIANYMEAMTMPLRVRDAKELEGLQVGDEVSFQLNVTDTRSWIDRIVRLGTRAAEEAKPATPPAPTLPGRPRHPLMDYSFTNELGEAVSLGQFRGRALAITFMFTRCPVPDYCPRLSKNFQEASRLLRSTPGAPTNWHFLSVTIDPEYDTPRTLKAYGEMYQYDPAHWSFLTGPPDKVAELARVSEITYQRSNGLLDHNFRTLIIDPAGRLQMVFPTSGDLSEAIAKEILKATAATNAAGPPGSPPAVAHTNLPVAVPRGRGD